MATPQIKIIATTTQGVEAAFTTFETAEGYTEAEIIALCGGIYVYPEADKDGKIVCEKDGSPSLWYWDAPPMERE